MKKLFIIVLILILLIGCNQTNAEEDIMAFEITEHDYFMSYYDEGDLYSRSYDFVDNYVNDDNVYFIASDVSSSDKEMETVFVSDEVPLVLNMTSNTYESLTNLKQETIPDSPLVVSHEPYQGKIGNVLSIMKISIIGGGPRTHYIQSTFYFDLKTGNEYSLEMLIKPKLREEFYLSVIDLIPPYLAKRMPSKEEYKEDLYREVVFHVSEEGLIFPAIIVPGELRTYYVEWEQIDSYLDKDSKFFMAIFDK